MTQGSTPATASLRLPAFLTVDQAHSLAVDLVWQLAQHAGSGDVAATRALLLRWAETVGPHRFGQVAMAAVLHVFESCLTVVPLDEMPPGATQFLPPAAVDA